MGSAEHIRRGALDTIRRRQEKGPKGIFFESPERAKRLRTFPFLFIESEQERKNPLYPRGVQFNPWTGSLVVPQWRSGKAKDSGDPIRTRKGGEGDQSIRLSEYNSVEAAMRGAIYASVGYRPGGSIKRSAELFMEHLDKLSLQFENGEIGRANIEYILMETLGVFDDIRYNKPTKENKKDAVEQALKALGEDSLGRLPNSLISQTRLASAWRKGLTEFLTASNVVRKYDKYFDALASVRMTERMAIGSVLQAAKDVKTYGGSFEGFQRTVAQLGQTAREQLTVDSIPTAPYRVPALVFSAGIGGFGEDGSLLGIADESRADVFAQRMLASQGQTGYTFMQRIREYGSIETIFDLSTLTRAEQTTAIFDRIRTYLPALQEAFDKGEDWTESVSGKFATL